MSGVIVYGIVLGYITIYIKLPAAAAVLRGNIITG
jgi:hypothetical protein